MVRRMKVEWDDREKGVVRDLLIQGWPALSRADRSIVFQILRSPDHRAITAAGSAHADFWESMIGLGWATRDEVDPAVPLLPDNRVFRFNDTGLRLFPSFADHFALHTVIVRAEQPEVKSQLQEHVDTIAEGVLLIPWSDLAERLPAGGTHVLCEDRRHYVAVTWDTKWLVGEGGPIEARLRGFLHPGHHKVAYETSRVVQKPSISGRLFRR